MKKPTFVLTTVAAAAVLLSGCAMGGTGTTPQSAPSVAVSPSGEVSGEITVWSWDVAAAALTRYAEDYVAEHPGTTIDVVDVGYDNAYDKISVGLQAGTGLPDLITMETERMPGYLESFPGEFVDLTPAIGADEADFDPSKWAAASVDGKIYAMPWDSGTVALYYRSDYLAEVGATPADITTWADLTAVAEKIHAKNGATLLDADLSTGSMFLRLLQQQGAGIFDEAGDIVINSDKAVSTLTWMQELQSKNLINNVKGWDARVTAAKAGKSAFLPEAVWWMGTLKGDAPELSGTYGVAPLPTFNADDLTTSNNGGSNLAIPAQAANAELAIDFASYVLMDVPRQVEMSETDGLFPAYLPALQDAAFEAEDEYFGGQQALKVFADLTASIPPVYFTGDYAKASEIVANATVEAILNGTDAKAALDGAAEAIAQQTGRTVS